MRHLLIGVCAASLPFIATAAEPAGQSELWMVYGGDMSTLSAMNVASIRREGSIARNQQVVVSYSGPLKAGDRTFDYVIIDVEYDCDAITQRSVRATFYDRTGKALWSNPLTDPARPAQQKAQAQYYMSVACQPIDRASVPNQAATLADVWGKNVWWNRKPDTASSQR